MATVPVPRTYVASENLTAAILNGTTGPKGAEDFLLSPPRVYAWQTTPTTLGTSGTAGLLLFDTESYDTDSNHSTSSNTSRLVCNATGLYDVRVNLFFATNSSGYRELQIRKNAAGSNVGGTVVGLARVAAFAGAAAQVYLAKDIPLTAGDYLEAFGLQNSGGSLALAGGNEYVTWASMRWVANS
jgi:hypothetical protein